jgi:hypothetical protein
LLHRQHLTPQVFHFVPPFFFSSLCPSHGQGSGGEPAALSSISFWSFSMTVASPGARDDGFADGRNDPKRCKSSMKSVEVTKILIYCFWVAYLVIYT